MSRDDFKKGIDLFNGRAKAFITDDGLEVYLKFEDRFDPDWIDGIKDFLDNSEISYGILNEPEMEEDRLVLARGTPPVKGQDGCIEIYPFPEDADKKFVGVYYDERVMSEIINVKKGQVVARKVPPTKGIPGKDVFKCPIKSIDGKWPVFKVGEGVEVSSDDRQLIATVTGRLFLDAEGAISVLKEWEINGSVDLSTGNIVFWGERLIVRGSVVGGMSVETWGDVEIGENIEDEATVKARGNLKVKGIIRAQNTRVFAGKDLQCGAIEYADIYVKGDLEIGDYLLDARCDIGGHFTAISGKGLVAGGIVRLGRSAAAKIFGTPANVKTVILAGRDPQLMKQYEIKIKELEDKSQQFLKVKKAIERLNKLKTVLKKNADTRGNDVGLIERLRDTAHSLADEMKKIRTDLDAMEKRIGQLHASKISVFDVCYPNVVIGIENAVLHLENELHSVVFRFKEGNISIFETNAHNIEKANS